MNFFAIFYSDVSISLAWPSFSFDPDSFRHHLERTSSDVFCVCCSSSLLSRDCRIGHSQCHRVLGLKENLFVDLLAS
jgi:hypothetical protein